MFSATVYRRVIRQNFWVSCYTRAWTYRPLPIVAARMGPQGYDVTQRQKHNITYKPYVAPCYKDHDQKNMTLKRPMSPHLTIYGPTLPAMTSIVQRITGIILTSYALLFAGGTLFLSNGIETYVSMIQSLDLSRPSILLIKIILGTPFCFHYYNGIRFCMWNLGRMLELKQVYGSAYKSFILTAATVLFFAFL